MLKIILLTIIYILIILGFYVLGFLLGKNDGYKEMKDLAVSSQIKCERLKMIIRAHRNMLLREETRLKALPKEDQKHNAIEYVDVKAKLKLIRKIEEDISNEM